MDGEKVSVSEEELEAADAYWVPALQSFYWDEKEVNDYLGRLMTDAFNQVFMHLHREVNRHENSGLYGCSATPGNGYVDQRHISISPRH